MGLFKDKEKPALVYNVENDNTSDTLSYPSEPDLTIGLHIIKIHQLEKTMLNDEIATYEANPDGDQTNTILPDAKIVCDTKTYKVVGEADYLSTMDKTKLRLVRFVSI